VKLFSGSSGRSSRRRPEPQLGSLPEHSNAFLILPVLKTGQLPEELAVSAYVKRAIRI